MKFKYQSFFDVSTSASSMQIIQFNVGGPEVLNRCRHLFGAYKYFRLGKISVKMVPASTLPVDPLQLSYDVSDPQAVDPRDQMNPGLVRITNGEDIFTNVSGLSSAQQEKVYQAMMLDPRWSKFMLQSGFRRSAYPLYWQIGQLHQDKFPGATTNVPNVVTAAGLSTINNPVPTFEYRVSETGNITTVGGSVGQSSARGLIQVGHKGRLGFLPTDYYQPESFASLTTVAGGVNNIPEVSVITCVLPKAYKTLYYYRIYVTEEVIFSGLRAAPYQANGIDQFVYGEPHVSFTGVTINDVSFIDNSGGDLP